MKKLIFLIVIAVLFFPGRACGEGGCNVESIHFLPPTYFIGDPAALRITLESGTDCVLTAPETFPSNRWVRIESADLEVSGERPVITVRFVTFYPGERTLPPIEFGDFVLKDVTLTPASAVEETGRDFAPFRSELLLPGTRLFFFVLFAGTAAVVLFLTLVLPRAKNMVSSLLRQRQVRLRKKKLLAEISKLKRDGGAIDPAMFYLRLSRGVKMYIGEKGMVDCLPLTPGEMWKVVDGTAELSGELSARLIETLRRSETVRFGGASASREQRAEDLRTVTAVIETMEAPQRAEADS